MSVHVPAGNARINVFIQVRFYVETSAPSVTKTFFISTVNKQNVGEWWRRLCVGSWGDLEEERGNGVRPQASPGWGWRVSINFINMSLLAKWYSLCLSRFISRNELLQWLSRWLSCPGVQKEHRSWLTEHRQFQFQPLQSASFISANFFRF